MSIIRVYFKIVRSHWKTLLIYLGIFFGIFSVFLMGAGEREDIKLYQGVKPSIALIDHDNSETSRALCAYLNKETKVLYENSSQKDSQDALFFGQISTIITIPEGFEKQLAQPKTIAIQQRPDDMNGTLLEQSIDKYLQTMKAYQQLYPKESMSQIQQRVDTQLHTKAKVTMETSKEISFAILLRGNYFNTASYIMIVIAIMLIGMTMLSFFDQELIKRNLISPQPQTKINLQLILCNVFVGLLIWLLLMMVIAFMAKDAFFTISGLLHVINAFLFMLVCVAMSFMICIFAMKSKHPGEMLNGFSNIVGLGSCFLCGAFVPQQLIGDSVLSFARMLPSYWYVWLNDKLTMATKVNDALWKDAFLTYGILFLFAMAFLCVALVMLRMQRSSDELEDTSMIPK